MNQSPAETALSRAMIRWSLSKAVPLAETATSWVYRVEQNGRDPAVVKLLKAGTGDEERRGAELLAWYAGEGTVTVFDRSEEAIFMEWVDGPPLGDPARAGRDEEATVALCQVIALLHAPRAAPPDSLVPLREWFGALFDARGRGWPPTARDLAARALGIAHALFDRQGQAVPLHGDLHHDNVLSSERGWLAIDPKGLLGDAAYETAPAFINPAGAARLCSDPARIARLADMFSARLGMNRKRVLGFAAAHAALSACWELAEGRPAALEIAVLPQLLVGYDLA